jgi:hypothetical protein
MPTFLTTGTEQKGRFKLRTFADSVIQTCAHFLGYRGNLLRHHDKRFDPS